MITIRKIDQNHMIVIILTQKHMNRWTFTVPLFYVHNCRAQTVLSLK